MEKDTIGTAASATPRKREQGTLLSAARTKLTNALLGFDDPFPSTDSLLDLRDTQSSPTPGASNLKQKTKKDVARGALHERPLVFMAFDESHSLTDPFDKDDDPRNTHFTQLRRVLRMLYGEPVFTFFLSTTGKISQFTGPRSVDPSSRIAQGMFQLIPPFVDLGFDQWMKHTKIKDDGSSSLEDVSKFEFMAMFGRPLCVALNHVFKIQVVMVHHS